MARNRSANDIYLLIQGYFLAPAYILAAIFIIRRFMLMPFDTFDYAFGIIPVIIVVYDLIDRYNSRKKS